MKFFEYNYHGKYKGYHIDVIYSPANDWWSCWYDGNMIYNQLSSREEGLDVLFNYIALNGI